VVIVGVGERRPFASARKTGKTSSWLTFFVGAGKATGVCLTGRSSTVEGTSSVFDRSDCLKVGKESLFRQAAPNIPHTVVKTSKRKNNRILPIFAYATRQSRL
jgi:hypothetical protein